MSNSKLLRRCNDFVQAEALRTRLDAAGILAIISGAEAHIALNYVGTALSGVRLEVAPEDYERADNLLQDDELKAATLGPWVCYDCSEQNEATFELCWNCQKPRDENDFQGRLDENESAPEVDLGLPIAASVQTDPIDDGNPYRPVLLSGERVDRSVPAQDVGLDSTIAETVARAYRASILGIVVFPPLLHLYSIALLVSAGKPALVSRELGGQTALTWFINLLVIAVATTGWMLLLAD